MTIRSLVPSFGKKTVPVRREEDHPFSLLRREMDEVFENFFSGFDMPFASNLDVFTPKVDLAETDKEIKVSAELPGMDEKDIDLSVNRDTLTIKGEKKSEKEEKGKDYYHVERSYGSFTRTIPIPVEVDLEKVDAEFKKGVLTITMPKTAKALKETKKITVKTE